MEEETERDLKGVYGVTRDYKGCREMRYLYTGAELVQLENKHHRTHGIQNYGFFPDVFPPKITMDDLDGLCESFWSNDTYIIKALKSKEDIVSFLTEPLEGICNYDDPPIQALRDTWSTLSEYCMYTGKKAETTARILKEHGLTREQTEFRDPRYQILIKAGMPEKDFDLDWPYDDDDYRYGAMYEALENGTYDQLVNNWK